VKNVKWDMGHAKCEMNNIIYRNRIRLYLLGVVLFLASCHGVVVQVDQIPSNTPADDPVYITGNFNNWDPGNERYILQMNEDSTYFIEIPRGFGSIEYKFTRGDWRTVEKDLCGFEMSNRRFLLGEADTVHSSIESWDDLDPVNCDRIIVVLTDIPHNTPKDNLALAGSFNSWIPDHDSRMTRDSTGNYTYTFYRGELDEISYKVTRGDMSSVETDVYGNDIPVRKLIFGRDDTVHIKVENWMDVAHQQSKNIVILCENIPENTAQDEEIYFVSNMNGWNPADKNWQLTKNSNGKYQISITRHKENVDYKFSRGSWLSVEVDQYGYEIPNRWLDFDGKDTIWIDIINWKDRSSVTDDVVTIYLDKIPGNTPGGEDIYIAGNFNGFDPSDKNFIMPKDHDGQYVINIPRKWGKLEFKFTRDGWDRVEIDRYGNDILNRTYFYHDIDTLHLQVWNWRDLPDPNIEGVTLILRELPEKTPEYAEFFLAGTINNWDPESESYKFINDNEGNIMIYVPKRGKLFEYKITRGKWKTVEVDKRGDPIPNRSLHFGFSDTSYIDIPKWRDFGGRY
jgi:hypothetical protein